MTGGLESYNRFALPQRTSLAIRVLGTYGGSAPGYRMTTFLIDGETALDAGSLTETLPFGAQRRVRRVVLTHAHFDHFASLPFLVANLVGRESAPLEVAAPEPVLSALRKHVFNDVTWPDFTRLPSPARPTLRFRPMSEGRPFRAGSVTLTPVPVSHLIPGYGYIVAKPGRSVVFSGDTAPTERLWRTARKVRNLKAIFLEVSFSDTQAEAADDSKHMTPRLVAEELAKMPPRVPVYLYHMKPPSLARIRREIAALREPRLKLLESERSFRF
jgi:ribonuclease BN (tRNA processing enzyme)